MKYGFYLLIFLAFLGCESENESKFNVEVPTSPDSDSLVIIGQIAYFPFDSSLFDRSKSFFPMSFSGVLDFSNIDQKFALSLQRKDYLQFAIPRTDTFAISFFIRNKTNVSQEGLQLIGIEKNMLVGLDAVSGATNLSIGGQVQKEVVNTYDSWLFVYIEWVKNSAQTRIVIRNIVDDVPFTKEYSMPVSIPVLPGDIVRLGSSGELLNGVNGFIDELRIYERSISLAELNSLGQ